MSRVRKIRLITTIMLVVLAYSEPRLWGEQHDAVIASPDSGLLCTGENFADYLRVMLLAGEMGISGHPNSGSSSEQQRLIENFLKIELPKNKTTIAVGHIGTGKVYTQTCESEKCTLEEMAAPERACLTDFWNDCPYLALRFQEKNYCFLVPADDPDEYYRSITNR